MKSNGLHDCQLLPHESSTTPTFQQEIGISQIYSWSISRDLFSVSDHLNVPSISYKYLTSFGPLSSFASSSVNIIMITQSRSSPSLFSLLFVNCWVIRRSQGVSYHFWCDLDSLKISVRLLAKGRSVLKFIYVIKSPERLIKPLCQSSERRDNPELKYTMSN